VFISLSLLLKFINQSMVKLKKAATKMVEIETSLIYSELAMEIQENALSLLWMEATNMLVCNTEVNAGLVILLENTERDQTVNAT